MTAAPEPPADRGRILVVDDHEANRQLLHDMLQLDGHDVIEAHNGVTALALARQHDPDVILLDVSMPDIDGFEVCRRLRAESTTAMTPVLLITALGQREDRLRGVSAGANDYLVKPVDHGEVSLRVRNAVRMRGMHRTLEQQFKSLQSLEQMRDALVSMLAHDLRSPLTGLRGFLELMEADLGGQLSRNLSQLLSEAVRSVDRLNGMIDDMLDVSRMESEALPLRYQHADLRDVVSRAIAALGPQPPFHKVEIRVEGESIDAICDVALMERVFLNIIANAVRFSPSGGEVHVRIAPELGGAAVRIADAGPGISLADQARIFDKFTQVGDARVSRARSTGLGLTFCRMVIDRHGGRIGVTSSPGDGSEFRVWLPGQGVTERH